MSLMRSCSLPGSPAFHRQPSTETFSSDSSQPSQRPIASPRPAISSLHTTADLQRHNSGNLASTSYRQPAAQQRLQRNSSWKEAAPSQVIELNDDDEDTLLPMRATNGRPIANGRRQPHQGPQARRTMPSSSSSFVDLTVDSPPVERSAIRRPVNRVNLEAIGRPTLRTVSGELSIQQSGSQPAPQQWPTQRRNSRNPSGNAVSSTDPSSQLDWLPNRHNGSTYAALELSDDDFASPLPDRTANGTSSQPRLDYLDRNRPRVVNGLGANAERDPLGFNR